MDFHGGGPKDRSVRVPRRLLPRMRRLPRRSHRGALGILAAGRPSRGTRCLGGLRCYQRRGAAPATARAAVAPSTPSCPPRAVPAVHGGRRARPRRSTSPRCTRSSFPWSFGPCAASSWTPPAHEDVRPGGVRRRAPAATGVPGPLVPLKTWVFGIVVNVVQAHLEVAAPPEPGPPRDRRDRGSRAARGAERPQPPTRP